MPSSSVFLNAGLKCDFFPRGNAVLSVCISKCTACRRGYWKQEQNLPCEGIGVEKKRLLGSKLADLMQERRIQIPGVFAVVSAPQRCLQTHKNNLRDDGRSRALSIAPPTIQIPPLAASNLGKTPEESYLETLKPLGHQPKPHQTPADRQKGNALRSRAWK